MLVANLLILATLFSGFQRPECEISLGPNIVIVYQSFQVSWVMDATVPISDTDATPVKQRIDGYYFQLDNGAKLSIKPVVGPPCNPGTAFADKIPYIYTKPTGLTVGPHQIKIWAWNYKLNSFGNPTDVKDISEVASLDMVALTKAQYYAPKAPTGLKVQFTPK